MRFLDPRLDLVPAEMAADLDEVRTPIEHLAHRFAPIVRPAREPKSSLIRRASLPLGAMATRRGDEPTGGEDPRTGETPVGHPRLQPEDPVERRDVAGG